MGFYYNYNRARWMDPAVGQFASLDPFEGLEFDPLSLHKYLHVHANPVNNVDPTGEGLFASTLAAINLRVTLIAISVPKLTTAVEGIVIGLAAAFSGVNFPSPAGLIGAGAREGSRRLPILARAFEIFRGRARLSLGRAFEKFLFEIVFREQAFRQVVIVGGRVAGFGAGPKGSRIIDFVWRGILIEARLSQAAFRLAQFKVFLGAAKNAGTDLWYFFLKAPNKQFVDELTALGRAEGARIRVFSVLP